MQRDAIARERAALEGGLQVDPSGKRGAGARFGRARGTQLIEPKFTSSLAAFLCARLFLTASERRNLAQRRADQP